MSTYQTLTPREAYAAYLMGSVVVDLRDADAVATKSADLKQLVKIPFSELDQRFGELPANRQVVFVSRVGVKGQEAAKFLLEHGFSNVAIVDGGLTAWEEEGLPVC